MDILKHDGIIEDSEIVYNLKDVEAFRDYKEVIVLPRFEGICVVLKYLNGELQSVITRGNGEFGCDVRKRAVQVKSLIYNIPTSSEVRIVGDIIAPKSSGLSRRQVSEMIEYDDSDVRGLTFRPHDIDIKTDWQEEMIFGFPPYDMNFVGYLNLMKAWGFDVADYEEFTGPAHDFLLNLVCDDRYKREGLIFRIRDDPKISWILHGL